MYTLEELKSKLKVMASDIRNKKSLRKQSPHGYVDGLSAAQWQFRHFHISYCLLRGTSYDKIEDPKNVGAPDWYKIEQIKNDCSNPKINKEESTDE